MSFVREKESRLVTSRFLTLPKRQIFDASKLKYFADDNSKFDENYKTFSKWVESSAGKGEISPFPTEFSKHLSCMTRKNQGLFGKELI